MAPSVAITQPRFLIIFIGNEYSARQSDTLKRARMPVHRALDMDTDHDLTQTVAPAHDVSDGKTRTCLKQLPA
jgi:hypothetical protein